MTKRFKEFDFYFAAALMLVVGLLAYCYVDHFSGELFLGIKPFVGYVSIGFAVMFALTGLCLSIKNRAGR